MQISESHGSCFLEVCFLASCRSLKLYIITLDYFTRGCAVGNVPQRLACLRVGLLLLYNVQDFVPVQGFSLAAQSLDLILEASGETRDAAPSM